jgi:hypothetical protein
VAKKHQTLDPDLGETNQFGPTWLQTSDTDVAPIFFYKIVFLFFFRSEKGACIEVPRRRKRSFTCPRCHRNCFTTARLERHLRWASTLVVVISSGIRILIWFRHFLETLVPGPESVLQNAAKHICEIISRERKVGNRYKTIFKKYFKICKVQSWTPSVISSTGTYLQFLYVSTRIIPARVR